MQALTVIREILETPAFLVGLVVMIGLLLQKKSVDQVIKGTATVVVGFALLSAGSDFLQNGALKDFGVLFNYDFHIQGVIPNMEAIASLGIAQHAAAVSSVMLGGMLANIVMARFGPWHYIFLTGHHTMYMACLLTIGMYGTGMKEWQIILASSLLLGLLMTMMPALIQNEMKIVTGGKKIAYGHFSAVGCFAATKAARFVTRRERLEKQNDDHLQKLKSTEEIHFSSKLAFMKDSAVGIFLVMTLIFLLLSGLASTRILLSRLNLSYREGGYRSWITYAIMQGAKFSASIYIILAGVRLIVAEIVPAFKGIAGKLVPHARPAVDCPILFSYAPNAVMIGFLMSFLGGIVTMAILIGINACQDAFVVPVIVPGVVAHFFCGGAAGVFANAEGGVKGCVAGSFLHGILISVLALLVMPVLGTLSPSGTTFSDSDFCVTGIILGKLSEIFSRQTVFGICIFCFVLPILWQQIKVHKNKLS